MAVDSNPVRRTKIGVTTPYSSAGEFHIPVGVGQGKATRMFIRNRWPEEAIGLRERRASARYPLEWDVGYRVIHRGSVSETGTGRTVNLSAGGILFDTRHSLPVGACIDLEVAWPVLLDGTVPLKFVANGRIVRSSSADGTAVKIRGHEFHTAGHPGRFAGG
jgi:hypothetical protein